MSEEPKVESHPVEYAVILIGIFLVAGVGYIIFVMNPQLPSDILQKIASYVAQFQPRPT